MWQKLTDWWKKFSCESEEWEYFKYLRRHPDRASFIEGKTKTQLAQELYDWKMRSSNQADEITALRGQIHLQELLLKSMLEEVNNYKARCKAYDERIRTHYKQVIK